MTHLSRRKLVQATELSSEELDYIVLPSKLEGDTFQIGTITQLPYAPVYIY